MPPDSPQPNVAGEGTSLGFSHRFWVLVVLTGAGAGIAAGLLMRLLRFVQHHAFSYSTGEFANAVARTSGAHRVLVLLAAGALAGVSLLLIHRYLGKGGGLTGAIWFQSGRLPMWKTIADGVLSITLVGMGAPVGREAAPKETAAALASRLAQWAKLSRGERRLLAACGAGAGMAAVYNLPFGGALFGLEVLLGALELSMVVPAVLTSAIAVSTSWLLIPNQATYSVPAYTFTSQQWLFAAITGPLIGLACVPYIRLLCWASTHKPEKARGTLLLPVLVLCVIGALSIWSPQLLGNGRDVVEVLIRNAMSLPMLFALAFLRPLVTAGSFRSGVPGGLFTPTMTFGAILGAISGRFFDHFWPGAPPGAYALLGSAAALAGATQGPASTVVMVLELTRWTDAIMVPLLVITGTATIATRLFETRSVYSGRMKIEFPAIQGSRDSALPVNPQHAISAAARYPAVLERMLALAPDAPGLYVLDQEGKVAGIIRRDAFSDRAGDYGAPRETATAYDLATPISVSSEARVPEHHL